MKKINNRWSPLLLLVLAVSAVAESPPATNPLLGQWRLALPNLLCSETYHFKENGILLAYSGAEVLESTYQFDPSPVTPGYYKLVDKTLSSNGKRDCAGNLSDIGLQSTNYVAFNADQTQFMWCDSASRDHCIGPLKRVQSGTE